MRTIKDISQSYYPMFSIENLLPWVATISRSYDFDGTEEANLMGVRAYYL